jgi:hypothetical protein
MNFSILHFGAKVSFAFGGGWIVDVEQAGKPQTGESFRFHQVQHSATHSIANHTKS